MSIYQDKKTGRLYIEFQYKKARYKERLPEGISKRDAERLLVKIKNDLMFQSHDVNESRSITFDKFIAEIYNGTTRNWNETRLERSVYILRAAQPFFKGKQMRHIKAADIEKFKQSRINLPTQHGTLRKPATVEREMAIISQVFSVAVRNDVIEYNPCSRVGKLQYDNLQDRILQESDEEAFFAAMSEWARDVCRFALHTGLRQNDIMSLTPFQVDLDDGTLTLIQGKTKRHQIVALNTIAVEILRGRMNKELIFASPVTGKAGSVRKSMERACAKIGIPRLTIRDLRRTNATRKIERGADAVTVAQSLGHTSLRMIPRYVRSLENLRKAADSLVNPATRLPETKIDNVKLLKRKG